MLEPRKCSVMRFHATSVTLCDFGVDDLPAVVKTGLERVYLVKSPGYVEVWLYPNVGVARLVLEHEALRLGVVADAGFEIVFHDAWRGYPRIHVVVDRLVDLEESLARAFVTHEAVHTVLHGSLEFYTSDPVQPSLLPMLYVAYTVVKDLEVHMWMADKGLRDELEVLRRYWDSIQVDCETLEGIMDEARRLTIYTALGAEAKPRCNNLEKLSVKLRELRVSRVRPWLRRREVFETLLECLGLREVVGSGPAGI